MYFRNLATVLLVGASLSGCTTFKQFSEDKSYGVSAAELALAPYSPVAPATDTKQNRKEYVWDAVNASENDCNRFVNGLVAAETGTDTGLDALTTVFSALGTAFTGTSTVHVLTAGSTIAGGWKTAIDSDAFAKASAADFSNAIQASYYKSLQDFGSKLDAKMQDSNSDPSDIDVSEEIAGLRSIHAQCSLAGAEATIHAGITPSSPAPSNAPLKTPEIGAAHNAALSASPITIPGGKVQ